MLCFRYALESSGNIEGPPRSYRRDVQSRRLRFRHHPARDHRQERALWCLRLWWTIRYVWVLFHGVVIHQCTPALRACCDPSKGDLNTIRRSISVPYRRIQPATFSWWMPSSKFVRIKLYENFIRIDTQNPLSIHCCFHWFLFHKVFIKSPWQSFSIVQVL